MLAAARQRAPQAEFLLADARDFTFAQPFDAVLSTADSLNHLLSRNELRKVFRNVHACLKPGGWFAFDLNRMEAFRDLWPNMPHIVDIDLVSVARASWDEARTIASCYFTQFRREQGLWLRSDYCIREKLHLEPDVLEDLQAAGFVDAQVFDAAALGMTGEIGQHRSFFLARRPEPAAA